MGRIKHFDRLRNSREFDAVYKRATKTWHTPLFVLFYRRDPSQYRVGFVAGKKVGNAVKRNRAKRLLRAHFLTHIDELAPGQYVFVAKAPLLKHGYSERSDAFKLALKRAGALQKNIPHSANNHSAKHLSKTSV